MKACSKCGEVKPLTEFYKQRDRLTSHCKSCIKAQKSEYGKANRAAIAAKCKRWRKANPERYLHHNAAWEARNPGVRKAISTRYRYNKKYASVGNSRAIQKIYEACPEGYEVDHFMPLSKGGQHHEENLCYLPQVDNRSKSGKHPANCEEQLRSIIWPKV